ncbi:hypothetical protein AK812_SmicGene9845 [Symbiodinium microadriaticum]|uniref:Uncharacterized protein n=1 Tax=Symbiodinium microadriaticum TaxID=2951 RepID=A0A1Q9EHB2_SYMMI|nr:hypothetical protein AK812_SmicGene9845 [Symbiodinium microadriaticum]
MAVLTIWRREYAGLLQALERQALPDPAERFRVHLVILAPSTVRQLLGFGAAGPRMRISTPILQVQDSQGVPALDSDNIKKKKKKTHQQQRIWDFELDARRWKKEDKEEERKSDRETERQTDRVTERGMKGSGRDWKGKETEKDENKKREQAAEPGASEGQEETKEFLNKEQTKRQRFGN